MTKIRIERTQSPKPKPQDESKLGFGKVFSDHMFITEYDVGEGWHDARIVPHQPISLDPAATVLHYAQEIFEGLKAYRRPDGEIGMFRAIDNARRMNQSAERICIPQLDEQLQLTAMETLVDVERDWVPKSEGTSLYLRPTCIAAGNELGVHPSKKYIYYIICAPSGAYYAGGLKPVRIHIEDHFVRAVKGGLGRAKTGGNYAASLKATFAAQEKGFDQVLWLDGRENRYIEEVGAMNMMFMIGDKLITPALGDTILPGITRDSIMRLAAARGVEVEERRIEVAELFAAGYAGTLTECFGTGTAAVISPVGELAYHGASIRPRYPEGRFAMELYRELTGIQRGILPDPYGWTSVVPHRV